MRFGGVLAVNNVNFTLRERELRCLIGPNGAGKSTLFKCLTGQHRVTHANGRVYVRGHDIAGWRPYQIVRLGVGIKTQVPSVMDGLSVRENIWLSAYRVAGSRDAGRLAAEAIDRLDLGTLAGATVGRLAHGERPRVELGLVMAARPWLVLRDEPAAGMTGEEVERMADIIREINRDATVVIVEHDMQFIRAIAGLVTVFVQGAVLIEDHVDVVMSDTRVRDVYLGRKG